MTPKAARILLLVLALGIVIVSMTVPGAARYLAYLWR